MKALAARQRTLACPFGDVVLAAVATGVDLMLWSELFASPAGRSRQLDWIVLAFGAAGFFLLLHRRRAPLLVFTALCAHAVAASLLLPYRPVIPVCVAFATLTAERGSRTALPASLLAVATSGAWVASEIRTAGGAGTGALPMPVARAVPYVVLLLVAGGIGRWQHANRQHISLLERRREEEARRAVAAERLRVARELHDIVAHTVTVMLLQAAGARRVMPVDPGRADAALGLVEQAGAEAMGELRRLLGVLRAGDAGSGSGSHNPTSRRGIGDLEALVETVRAAGLHVRVAVVGRRRRLDASVDLAAYRVAQEALTNVTKHAGPAARVVCRLEWSDDWVVVEVEDDGKGAAPKDPRLSTGHGLLGLAERVSMVGGTLSAAPVPSGGFRVAARLPIAHPGPGGLADGPEVAPGSAPRGAARDAGALVGGLA